MIGTAHPIGTDAPDLIQPFQLDLPDLRGRMVRLGPALDDILAHHAYPPPVARVVAEMATVAVLLASLLKYEGIFTLQVKGDGPVRLLVADVTSAGIVRAYGQFDADTVPEDVDTPLKALTGEGYLAFTVDQGEDTERYQGIVSLEGQTISDALRHYFHQSEQLDTGMVLTAQQDDGHWRSGAIILQKMPGDGPDFSIEPVVDENWRRGMLLLSTCSDSELLDAALPPTELIYRLFNEEDIIVYPPHSVRHGCRCSEERVRAVMEALPPAELEALRVDGKLVITCEICNREYVL
jgi:molecular chaperone Hsp33